LVRATVTYFAIALAGAAALMWMPFARVAGRGGERQFITEFGAGTSVTQGFEMSANGLRAIRVRLASAGGADVTFGYRLSLAAPGKDLVELRRSTEIVRDLRGERWVTLAFPDILQSAGMWCELELHVIDARGDVALVAYRERTIRPAMLRVGDKERWGSLAFEAMAAGDTALGRFRLAATNPIPELVRAPLFVATVLGVYTLLFLPLLSVLVRSDRPTSPPSFGTARRLRGAAVCLVLVASAVASIWIARAERGRINLLDTIHHAHIESLAIARFVEVTSVDIDVGQSRALFAHAPTSVAWSIVPPPAARLQTAVTLSPGVWDLEGDGVVFTVRVNDGTRVNDLFSRHVNPKRVPADRHWIPVDIDLSHYAGRAITLVLVTDPSPSGDPAHDWALWREPRIVTRGRG
jgi:hypothetical protein